MGHEGSAEGLLQATHPARGDALPHVHRQIPRRTVVRGLLAALGAGAALALGGREMFTDHTTLEQRTAENFLKNAQENQMMTNLVVSGEAGANMRTKPATPIGKGPDGVAGEVVGKLEPSDIISKAIVVLGGDPLRPMDRESKSPWFAFQKPGSDEIVFAWSGNFRPEDQAKASGVTPFELKNR